MENSFTCCNYYLLYADTEIFWFLIFFFTSRQNYSNVEESIFHYMSSHIECRFNIPLKISPFPSWIGLNMKYLCMYSVLTIREKLWNVTYLNTNSFPSRKDNFTSTYHLCILFILIGIGVITTLNLHAHLLYVNSPKHCKDNSKQGTTKSSKISWL